MNVKPVIAWENLLADNGVTVTHTADAEGYPFQNLTDLRDYTLWKPSGSGEVYVKLDAGEGNTVTADTWAVAGHNLYSAGVTGMGLYWSDDDVTYTPCLEPQDPADDSVFFRKFVSVSCRFLKMVIPSGYSETPYMGVLFLGAALTFPVYPDPGFDPDGEEIESAVRYSRCGNLLGVAERYRKRNILIEFSRLPAFFIENEWMEFYKSHGTKPFFFAWDSAGRPEQARFVRLAGNKMESPYEGPWRSLSLSFTGKAE
ncbi:MAG: hypothetical protein R6V10_02235 [bacterium]